MTVGQYMTVGQAGPLGNLHRNCNSVILALPGKLRDFVAGLRSSVGDHYLPGVLSRCIAEMLTVLARARHMPVLEKVGLQTSSWDVSAPSLSSELLDLRKGLKAIQGVASQDYHFAPWFMLCHATLNPKP